MRRTNDSLAPWLESFSRPIDRARRTVLSTAAPLLQPLFANRSLRITVLASVVLTLSFIFSTTLPCWQLALGPIVLGIPHLVGDLRYLVCKEDLHKTIPFWALVAAPLLAFLIHQHSALGALSIFGATLLAKPTRMGLLISMAAALLVGIAVVYPRGVLYTLLHAHNVIAIAFWWFWRKNRHPWESIPLLLCLMFSAFLLVAPVSSESLHPTNLSLSYFQQTLAPFASEDWSLRLVLLYAFLQSFHYGIWISLIPEEARPQPTPQSVRKRLAALQTDFTSIGIAIVFVSMVGLLFWGLVNLKAARSNYLYAISFHGFLELAVCGYWLTSKFR